VRALLLRTATRSSRLSGCRVTGHSPVSASAFSMRRLSKSSPLGLATTGSSGGAPQMAQSMAARYWAKASV